MEWLLAPMSSLLAALLIVPVIVLLGAAVLLMIGHIVPGGPTLSRVAFHCPFSRRRVTVEFLSPSGAAKPTDVLSCSVFSNPYHIRCEKRCLGMAETGWMPSPLMPRFALLADGVAYRTVDSAEGPAPEGPPKDGVPRAA